MNKVILDDKNYETIKVTRLRENGREVTPYRVIRKGFDRKRQSWRSQEAEYCLQKEQQGQRP